MIDLHCHSTASDGTVAPRELPPLAASCGLKALALTDHDTISGIDEFMAAAASVPQVHCIPGIELAGHLESGEHCHIVGLFVNSQNSELKSLCEQILVWREERNRAIVAKLGELGMPFDFDKLKESCGGTVGRPHIAEYMVVKGYCRTMPDAFNNYISRGKPAYVSREVPTVARCIEAIHQAGGLAIWAHPMTSSSRTQAKCQSIAMEMRKSGLDGIEAYYTEHTPSQQNTVLRLADRLHLLVSGGSDFHGEHIANITLGRGHGDLCVPDCLLERMMQARG